MDLFCNETEDCIRSEDDTAILSDDRVFQRLLATEDRYAITCNYCKRVQTEITVPMRRICVSWMLEVCEEEKCENCIFPLAVNYLDRFLSEVSVRKSRLQLLGCVCLMIATKIRQCIPIDARKLSFYSDYAFSHTDILDWELLVLGRLKWDIGSILPIDYLDLLVSKLPSEDVRPMVKKHALVFLEICTLEFKFCMWPASRIALGCVCAAVSGIPSAKTLWPSISDIAEFFHGVTAIEAGIITQFTTLIEEEIGGHIRMAFRKETVEKNPGLSSMTNGKAMCNNNHPGVKDSSDQRLETPTDVYDIIV